MNDADFILHTHGDRSLTLSQAVLLYRGPNAALATIHPVREVDGELTILAGKPMTLRDAGQWVRALARRAAYRGFIPENVLYVDGDLLVWWTPPGRRHIAFRGEAIGATERGEVVPHPGLVFAVSPRFWRVWAVKGRERPTPASALFQAPYFNVNEQGEICHGTVSRPSGTTVDQITAWNTAFFGSFFTHPNVQRRLVKYRGGGKQFWRDMLDGQFSRFPQRVLVDLKTTLGQLLKIKEAKND